MKADKMYKENAEYLKVGTAKVDNFLNGTTKKINKVNFINGKVKK